METTSSLSSRGWRIAFLVLCTAGIALSADLLRLHVNVHTDPHYHSYCAMSERVNCETVAASDHAVVLFLPLAVWGLLGYLMMGGLAIWSLRARQRSESWPFGYLLCLSLFSTIASLALFLLSHFAIHSLCIVCMATYLVNILLLAVSAIELRRIKHGLLSATTSDLRETLKQPVPPLVYFGGFSGVVLLLSLAMPTYWIVEKEAGPGGLTVGHTSQGHPWIGAKSPVLEIVEYSDYQCPYCSRAHSTLRKLVAKHADRVRLVHRNYPLDQACNPSVKRPFHVYACSYALLAQCADQQDKFWTASDFLFSNGRRHDPVSAEEFASAIGLDESVLMTCLESPTAKKAVAIDLAAGLKLNIRGTPTFVVDGKSYPGHLPPEVIDEALTAGTKKQLETPPPSEH